MSSHRRKSLSIFRPQLSSLTPINDSDDGESAVRSDSKKKSRNSSLFSASPTNSPSPVSAAGSQEHGLPSARPRTLQKSNARPSSIFGSLRSMHSLYDEDETLLRSATAQSGPGHQEDTGTKLDAEQMTVLHHGEVQTAGSMFRKRSQYLVLSNTHLLRFKNQGKAAELFTEVPLPTGRSNSVRHSRVNSGESGSESSFYADPHAAIALRNVVAAYKLDDGRPYFTIELAHYDEATNHASTMSMQLNDPRESEIWLGSIREAKIK